MTDNTGAERWSDDLWLERVGAAWKVGVPSEVLTPATSAEPDVPIQETPYEGEPQNPSRLVSAEELKRLGLSTLSSDASRASRGGAGNSASLAAATKYCFKQFVQMTGDGIGEDYFSSDGFYFMGNHFIYIQGQVYWLDYLGCTPALTLTSSQTATLYTAANTGSEVITVDNNRDGLWLTASVTVSPGSGGSLWYLILPHSTKQQAFNIARLATSAYSRTHVTGASINVTVHGLSTV